MLNAHSTVRSDNRSATIVGGMASCDPLRSFLKPQPQGQAQTLPASEAVRRRGPRGRAAAHPKCTSSRGLYEAKELQGRPRLDLLNVCGEFEPLFSLLAPDVPDAAGPGRSRTLGAERNGNCHALWRGHYRDAHVLEKGRMTETCPCAGSHSKQLGPSEMLFMDEAVSERTAHLQHN